MKTVIGDLIRNTRLQDASYISDAHDWIYEAMELMQVHQTLQGRWMDITTSFHKAPLPCDLVELDAVEYCGRRLREGGGVRPAEKDCPPRRTSLFVSTVDKVLLENHLFYEGAITQVTALGYYPEAYYYTDMGTLNTSFPKGTVTVYYRGVATGTDGMPLIPNNRNYKLALYWYCRAMMIGAGYPDKQFTFDHCWQMWEKIYAPRAVSELTMPSPEQMERRVNNYVRLLPDAGYYDSFFSDPGPEADYHLEPYNRTI